MTKGIIAGFVSTIIFVITMGTLYLVFDGLNNSPLTSTHESKAILDSTKQSLNIVLFGWQLANDIQDVIGILAILVTLLGLGIGTFCIFKKNSRY